MTKPLTTLTPSQVQSHIAGHVAAVLAARIVAEVKREAVDKVATRIMSEGQYKDDEGNAVLIPKHSYLIIESQWDGYFSRLRTEMAAAGLHGSKPEFCPALEAENALMEAERALINHAGKIIDGINSDSVWKVKDGWKKCVELLCGLALAKTPKRRR